MGAGGEVMRTKEIIYQLELLIEEFHIKQSKELTFDGAQVIYVTEKEIKAAEDAVKRLKSDRASKIIDIITAVGVFLFLLLLAIVIAIR